MFQVQRYNKPRFQLIKRQTKQCRIYRKKNLTRVGQTEPTANNMKMKS